VLDAVAAARTGTLERGHGQDELRPGDAMDGDVPEPLVRSGDPRFEVGQRREVLVVEQDLDRAAGQSGAGDVHPFGRHRVHALRQTTVDERADQVVDVVRRSVADRRR